MGKNFIPENRIEMVELGELCQKISVGLAISVTPYMRDRGTKLIRNQNIRQNYFDSSSLVYVDDEFAKSQNSKRVKIGDVIAVRTGANIGDTCIVPDEFDGALTFTTLIARPNKKLLDCQYLSQYMNSSLGRSEVNRLMAGGGKGNLNAGELKKYLVLLPPITEQRKIGEILSTWDKAIALLEQLITAKRKLKQGLMQQLLTGKKQFKEFEGLEWEVKKIKNIGKVISGGTPDTNNPDYWNGDIPWCTPSEITALKDKYMSFTNRTISNEGVKSSSTAILPINSLLVCTRATIGYCAINTVPMCTNQGFKNLIPNKQYFVSYLYYKFLLEKHQLLRLASGSTFLEISKKDFESIEIDIPSLAEQQKIASILSTADAEISNLEKQLAAYKQQKRGLMQQLLTGKKRVKIDEPQMQKV